MTNHFELPLFIPVRPSIWFVAGFYTAHLGAILALLASNIPLVIQAVIIARVLASLIHGHGLHIIQKNPASPVQLVLNQAGEWWLSITSGDTLPVELKPMAFVHPLLVVLIFKGETGSYRVILTPDMVDPDTYRRLRVRLRFRHHQM
jgi:hypothetical protein